MPLRTNVYVDGFNLYYGCIKGTRYHWLDIRRLCRLLLKPEKHEINRIRYCTAHVQARPDDPEEPLRQKAYLLALETIPNLTIHYGHFLTKIEHRALAVPPVGAPPDAWARRTPGGPSRAWIRRTEEKGSDVNLATLMLCDGFASDYEAAVIISNDSDLLMPTEVVRSQLNRVVGVLYPHDKPSAELKKAASFMKPIRQGALSASQFPPVVEGSHGPIAKPKAWS